MVLSLRRGRERCCAGAAQALRLGLAERKIGGRKVAQIGLL